MTPSRFVSIAAPAVLAVVAGCAVPPDAGFADVAHAVGLAGGPKLHWVRGGPEDEANTAVVRGLLQQEMTVEQAVHAALLNNPNLQATYEDLGVAQAELVQAGLLTNPSVEFEVRFPSAPFEVHAVADFVELLLMPMRRRAAEAAFDQVKRRVVHAVLNHAADTKAAYYELAAAMQRLELRQAVTKAAEWAAEAATRLHKAGNITDLERDKYAVQHAGARLDLARSEAEVNEAREKLAVLLGLWGQDLSFRIRGRLPELPEREITPTGLESAALKGRSDLAAARHEVEAGARRLGLEKASAVLPFLHVGAHIEREPGGPTTYGPSFEIAVPIFDQGQARTFAAEAELRRARQKYAALAVEIRSQVRSARNRLLESRRTAEFHLRVVLPLRERIVKETLLHYNAMQFGVFHLLSARQEQVEAARGYIETLRSYWTARTELERALGGKLPEDSSGAATVAPPPKPPAPGHQH